MTFIAWAALIRGAIAFGLILGVNDDLDTDTDELPIRDVLESSTCFLVIITTLVFGSFTPMVQKCLLKPQSQIFEIMLDDAKSQISDHSFKPFVNNFSIN